MVSISLPRSWDGQRASSPHVKLLQPPDSPSSHSRLAVNQDVVEIPSHLWEHFVTDHRTAGVIARHATTREPLPRALHSALLASHNAFPALELQQQVGRGAAAGGGLSNSHACSEHLPLASDVCPQRAVSMH